MHSHTFTKLDYPALDVLPCSAYSIFKRQENYSVK